MYVHSCWCTSSGIGIASGVAALDLRERVEDRFGDLGDAIHDADRPRAAASLAQPRARLAADYWLIAFGGPAARRRLASCARQSLGQSRACDRSARVARAPRSRSRAERCAARAAEVVAAGFEHAALARRAPRSAQPAAARARATRARGACTITRAENAYALGRDRARHVGGKIAARNRPRREARGRRSVCSARGRHGRCGSRRAIGSQPTRYQRRPLCTSPCGSIVALSCCAPCGRRSESAVAPDRGSAGDDREPARHRRSVPTVQRHDRAMQRLHAPAQACRQNLLELAERAHRRLPRCR